MRLLFACVVLLLGPGFVSARDLPPPRGVQVAIAVDSTGHVVKADVASDVPKATAQRIVERVSQFEFTPASRNGTAVECTTTLWLAFAFEAVDEKNVAIRITDAYTSPGLVDRKGNNPGYPAGMIRKRVDSDVQLELAYDAKGRVTGTKVLQSTGDPSFGKAAAMMAGKWRLVPERVAGQGVAGSVVVPVSFRISDGHKPRALPATRSFERVDNAAADAGRELVAQSEVALRTAVAGTLL